MAAIDADTIARMTGMELLQALVRGEVPPPGMGVTMGFRPVELAPGRAVFEGQAGPNLLNPLGGVHGGFALTLIDSAAGCALHTELEAGMGYASVETKTNFVRPVPVDCLVRCEGRVLSRGRQIASAEAFLRDEAGKLLAHGTSTLMIFPLR